MAWERLRAAGVGGWSKTDHCHPHTERLIRGDIFAMFGCLDGATVLNKTHEMNLLI
jgi:hypothetical protein